MFVTEKMLLPVISLTGMCASNLQIHFPVDLEQKKFDTHLLICQLFAIPNEYEILHRSQRLIQLNPETIFNTFAQNVMDIQNFMTYAIKMSFVWNFYIATAAWILICRQLRPRWSFWWRWYPITTFFPLGLTCVFILNNAFHRMRSHH